MGFVRISDQMYFFTLGKCSIIVSSVSIMVFTLIVSHSNLENNVILNVKNNFRRLVSYAEMYTCIVNFINFVHFS